MHGVVLTVWLIAWPDLCIMSSHSAVFRSSCLSLYQQLLEAAKETCMFCFSETQGTDGQLVGAGLALLGSVDEKFVEVTDLYEPNESGQRDKAFISKGYDATSHFETTVEDVLEMYTRITGKVLDLSSKDPTQA